MLYAGETFASFASIWFYFPRKIMQTDHPKRREWNYLSVKREFRKLCCSIIRTVNWENHVYRLEKDREWNLVNTEIVRIIFDEKYY